MISYLLIFWLVYECLAYLLYIIFRFFGDNNNSKTGTGLTIPVDETDEIPTDKNLQTDTPME